MECCSCSLHELASHSLISALFAVLCGASARPRHPNSLSTGKLLNTGQLKTTLPRVQPGAKGTNLFSSHVSQLPPSSGFQYRHRWLICSSLVITAFAAAPSLSPLLLPLPPALLLLLRPRGCSRVIIFERHVGQAATKRTQ